MAARLGRDLAYIDGWSLGLDLHILLRTLQVLLGDPRAY
jgi:lipopolysaccharide/colanic/teichoic acid biosynthesis glycosyltransferase